MDKIETIVKNPSLSLAVNPLRNWDVELQPLTFANGGNTRFFGLRSTDNGAMVGKPVTSRYGVITNTMLLDVVEKSVSGTSLNLFNVGSISQRGKVFLQFKLPENIKGAGREMEQYLNFLNPLDCTGNFTANTGNTWIICQNTFKMALKTKGELLDVRITHSREQVKKIENLPALVDAACGVNAEFARAMDELANIPVKGELIGARNIFAGFLSDGKELSTNAYNRAENLAGLFMNGKGNRGENAADLFGAITDSFSHEAPAKEKKTEAEIFEWSEFTTGQANKEGFWLELWNEKENKPRANRIKELHSIGSKAIKEYETENA